MSKKLAVMGFLAGLINPPETKPEVPKGQINDITFPNSLRYPDFSKLVDYLVSRLDRGEIELKGRYTRTTSSLEGLETNTKISTDGLIGIVNGSGYMLPFRVPDSVHADYVNYKGIEYVRNHPLLKNPSEGQIKLAADLEKMVSDYFATLSR